MSIPMNIVKGTRVVAEWVDARLGALAGVQMKAIATKHSVSGVVRHVRGDHPFAPTVIRLYVEAEDGTPCEKCGVKEVEVDPKHVVEIDGKPVRVDLTDEPVAIMK